MDEEEFVEDEDEDSVNIDDVGYDDQNCEKSVNNNNFPRPDPGAYSGFAPFPYPYPEEVHGHRDNCDSDRPQQSSFSELGHFSAFRYLQQNNQENSSPRRPSTEFNYAKGYPVKDSVEGPESSASKTSELYPVRQNHPTMLEHKLPFNFLGPPLAALHSMTEMKSSLGGGGDSNNNSTSAPSMSSPNAGLTAQTMHGQANAPNPHGIDTILSRPPPVTSAGLSSLTAG